MKKKEKRDENDDKFFLVFFLGCIVSCINREDEKESFLLCFAHERKIHAK